MMDIFEWCAAYKEASIVWDGASIEAWVKANPPPIRPGDRVKLIRGSRAYVVARISLERTEAYPQVTVYSDGPDGCVAASNCSLIAFERL